MFVDFHSTFCLTNCKKRGKILEKGEAMGSNVTAINFPKEDELTLKLKIRTSTEEDRDYFLLPSGEINPGFLADCFDMMEMIKHHVVTINDYTLLEYQKILQNEVKL